MLKKGSTIAVIAPAGIPDMEQVQKGMALLRDWGYQVREGRHLRERFRHNAGTAAQRTEDLLWALSDPQVDAVWLARGGYGCIHCLAGLPATLPGEKMVIGFSDATSLFGALRGKGRFTLVHGPMLENLAVGIDEPSRESIRALLSGERRVPMRGEHAWGPAHEITAPVIGGNLTVFASIAGTASAIRAKDAIVVLEDVTELAYRIDRSVCQLLASGFFEGVKAVALGEFIRCPVPPESDFTVQDLLIDLLKPLGVPIITGLGVGHGERNLSWLIGERGTLRDGGIYFENTL
jgi:muramoyltetrapeptide carboxypeptidase